MKITLLGVAFILIVFITAKSFAGASKTAESSDELKHSGSTHPAIRELQELLYGVNYQVSLGLYGPFSADISLEEGLKKEISPDISLRPVAPSSLVEMKKEIENCLLYKGEPTSGPVELAKKRVRILELMQELFTKINADRASAINVFSFIEGDPFYPVWWSFAYQVQSGGIHWVILGSASD